MYGVVLLTSTLIALAGARIYERCELARDLLRFGLNREHVATWVCIAFHESRYDTAARNPHSGDHGLLQISELYWCGPGKACGVPCSSFRNDDIYDDVQCALRIHKEHTRLQGDGFLAWVVYPQHCKHNAKKYIAGCRSVKNIPMKLDDRSRYLKSFENNTTDLHVESQQDNNRLKPKYLAISELFKENNEGVYINDKTPHNWVSFKIDNIDKLRLPNFNRIRNYEFTTPAPTTTTIDPDLVGIKPPSPRKIESNQFRRRMMNLVSVSMKHDDKYDYVPRKLYVEVTPVNKPFEPIDLSQNPFIKLQTFTSKIPTEMPYPTRESSSVAPEHVNSSTWITPTTIETSTPVSTLSDESLSTRNESSSLQTTMPSLIISRRGKSRYVPDRNYEYIRTRRPQTTTSTTTSPPFTMSVSLTTTTQAEDNPSTKIESSKNVKPASESVEATTETSKVNNSSKSVEAVQANSPPLAGSSSDITQNYETTPKPPTVSTLSVTPMSRFWESSRQTTTPHPATSRPQSTWTSLRASAPTASVPTTKKTHSSTQTTPDVNHNATTSTESAPTAKTTWSIFDLYLNPTKATFKPFKFTPIENSLYKLRIFSGGTTTPHPSYRGMKTHSR